MENTKTDTEVFDDTNCDYPGWVDEIQKALNELIIEEKLPEESLRIICNKSKKNKNEITSYSVCIFEPDYPADKTGYTRADTENNASLLMIKEKEKNIKNKKEKTGILEILISDIQFYDMGKDVFKEFEIKEGSPDVKIFIDKHDSRLIKLVIENVKYGINNYSSKAKRFGCCSRFKDCSSEKRCVHPNKLYAHACMYFSQLQEGKIFYGKNENI